MQSKHGPGVVQHKQSLRAPPSFLPVSLLSLDVFDHHLASGMAPVANVPRVPARLPAKTPHRAAGVKKGAILWELV